MIIRPARPDEGPAVAAIRVASWREAYAGLAPTSFLAAMPADEEHWSAVAHGEHAETGLIVCEADDRVVGFACYGAARPPCFDFSCELYAIYFLPDAIGKGYGAATMRAAMTALFRLGHTDMMLWVMEKNARAIRFYRDAGGAVLPDSRRSFSIHDTEIWEIAYGFRPLSASRATG
jgi:ribosomal protein S18 acetylase RimI-like enzyme